MTGDRYITIDELISMNDQTHLLAICGIGGPNSAGGRQIDRDRLQTIINRANSLIDGYLKSRYPRIAKIAVGDMDDSLKGAASDLVIYWLRDRVGDKAGVDDTVKTRYRDIINWLKEIRDGQVELNLPGLFSTNETNNPSGIRGAFPPSAAAKALDGF